MGDFHETTTRRARKRHACDVCNRPIVPGALYAYGRGIFDGYWYAWHQHLACRALTLAWWRATDRDWEDMPAPGDARAYITDLAERLSEREGTAARLRASHAHVMEYRETTPNPPLRRAALGWEAILRELTQDADPADVAYLRGLYAQHAGCPTCGAEVHDEGYACANGHQEPAP